MMASRYVIKSNWFGCMNVYHDRLTMAARRNGQRMRGKSWRGEKNNRKACGHPFLFSSKRLALV